MGRSEELFERAVKRIPGGVNSPVRAYGAIGMAPRFIKRADGCHIYDVDDNCYVDYIDSWGPMILGHNFPEIREAVVKACAEGLSFGCATEIEVEMAEFICEHLPHVEMVRMVNSGTEAVMSAIRAARGYTGRDKIIKFAGCYHGHSDALLVSAGSGVMTSGVPDSAGVPKGCTQDTMTAVYNDLDSVKALLEQAKGQVAAVIVEPVAANMGVVAPKKGFLEGLRTLCDQHGTLLIFDEVITGFRLALAVPLNILRNTGYGDLRQDHRCGYAVGAYGGRREIMEMVSPAGPVYQAGTLSGNPIAMAAGLTQLKYLYEHQEVYKDLEEKGQKLYGGIEEILKEAGSEYHVNHVSSLGSLFFAKEEVVDYTSAKSSDTKAFADYFLAMLKQGIHLAPSQFEAMFLSTAHSDEVLEDTLTKIRNYFM